MDLGTFLTELKRRNVYKVAFGYGVVGWLVMQVAATIVPALHLPDSLTTAVVVIVLLSFPIAIVIAWAFEMTPDGMKRTEDISPNDKIPQWSRTKFAIFVVGVALLAAGFMGFHLWGSKPAKTAAGAAAPSIATSIARAIPAKSIAVLPFENLSAEKENAYFVEGIQDEILTRLAKISALKVISRTSTMRYASRPDNLREIGRQLSVATILEGSVQRAEGTMRVNLQLIDAASDTHFWAETYDREVKNIFSVESEVAQSVADALQATLLPAESARISAVPTKNPAAYDFFLKGEYEHRAALAAQIPQAFDKAAAWYQEAIARDPNFALAMAQLVVCRMRRHWLAESLSEAELVEVERVAKQALTLAPDLPEAHIALGVYHYYGSRQYELALAEFQRALELQPNNSEALSFSGYVHRRQGKWDSALDELAKSLKQDPRNATLEANVAQTYLILRRWKEARTTAQHALTIDLEI
ncbi:MAG: tetratricopeptide repeat protein [Chthoniobacterales bacterium]